MPFNLPTVTGRPLQNHSTRIVGSPMGSNRHSRWIFFPSFTGFGSESGCTKIGFDLEISSIWYCGSTNLEPSRCCVFSIAERCMLVVSILERTAMQISCVQHTYSWSFMNIYNAVECKDHKLKMLHSSRSAEHLSLFCWVLTSSCNHAAVSNYTESCQPHWDTVFHTHTGSQCTSKTANNVQH